MFRDDQLLPISALQHLLFCPRQAALIHVEQLWADNRLTVQGEQLHRKAHDGPDTTRNGVRVARGMHLASYQHGLFGIADVVEFHTPGTTDLPDQQTVLPVEYKRGRPKSHDADRVQLCAQAICLEEMLQTSLAVGHLFYGQPRRRQVVQLDAALRQITLQAIAELHHMIQAGHTPTARREKKCDRCSLLHLCLPGALRPRHTAGHYLENAVAQALTQTP